MLRQSSRSVLCTVVLGLLLGLHQTPLLMAELPSLIPREVLFGNPERTRPKISPDGKRIAWLAPDENNVLQVWIQTIGEEDARTVTSDEKRGIRRYVWAENDKTILYLQDSDGDENWHLFGVDLETGTVRDYTAFKGVRAEPVTIDPGFPNDLLVMMNARDRSLFDIYRLNLETGALVLDTENPGGFMGFVADSKLQVRSAEVATPDGGTDVQVRDSAEDPWRSWMTVGPDEILGVLEFSADGKSAILVSSIGSDTARIVQKELATGEEKVLASSDEVDVGDVVVHPRTHEVQAVSFAPGRTHWVVVDPSVKADFEGIAELYDGDFSIVNRDRSDNIWLVQFTSDRGPNRFYSWDREAKKGTFLFVSRPELEGLELAAMKPVKLKARDGLALHAYLTLPPGVRGKKLPMVLLVHGGPWARDSWGYNPWAQWFANRGYACLQVNFRGSVGYGKSFTNAGNKQWGLKMHDDLIDAVNWAVKKGYADKNKVAIAGGSYGGYAALAGVTFTPEVFACAVDIVGPSNLETLVRSFPPYWKPIRTRVDVRVGNIDDPEDAALLKAASPLFKADKIVRPLLIGQGANDPRVNQAESEQIVAAIEKNNGSVTYVLYPDEGHGFARPENRIDFNARTEAFLAECLGGRLEPLEGDTYPGSSAVVRVVGPR